MCQWCGNTLKDRRSITRSGTSRRSSGRSACGTMFQSTNAMCGIDFVTPLQGLMICVGCESQGVALGYHAMRLRRGPSEVRHRTSSLIFQSAFRMPEKKTGTPSIARTQLGRATFLPSDVRRSGPQTVFENQSSLSGRTERPSQDSPGQSEATPWVRVHRESQALKGRNNSAFRVPRSAF